jgi:hypothetical protein
MSDRNYMKRIDCDDVGCAHALIYKLYSVDICRLRRLIGHVYFSQKSMCVYIAECRYLFSEVFLKSRCLATYLFCILKPLVTLACAGREQFCIGAWQIILKFTNPKNCQQKWYQPFYCTCTWLSKILQARIRF